MPRAVLILQSKTNFFYNLIFVSHFIYFFFTFSSTNISQFTLRNREKKKLFLMCHTRQPSFDQFNYILIYQLCTDNGNRLTFHFPLKKIFFIIPPMKSTTLCFQVFNNVIYTKKQTILNHFLPPTI